MSNKGMKIKKLAKELGITSRDLIDRCRAEGLPVQNSATKVEVELERVIRGWFAHRETSKDPVEPPRAS